jgi:hypothetical protein
VSGPSTVNYRHNTDCESINDRTPITVLISQKVYD